MGWSFSPCAPSDSSQEHGGPSTPGASVETESSYELGLQGPRFGCGLGQCGACTVHLDGAAVRSCTLAVSAVGDRPVTTLEGLSTDGRLHPVQQAVIDEQAMQCGYCINGWIMASAARRQSPTPSSMHPSASSTCPAGRRAQAEEDAPR